ncbi:YciI family protein [Microlunatus soli]|uniref:Uncharacterized conserved protein n=1 Tax=Microlunatus soli TaxID=630515 RepID=A0A1H1QU30_9ACTN|nr:YciI family protein [Microlunatus soli]SDS27008.1 Uncharacterized conserved protein [Microlunatus soli]
MRVVAFMMGNADSETGRIPSSEEFAEMGRFNQTLVDAGVLLAADGLHPTADSAKLHWTGDGPTVIDGPFTEAKEVVAGFWIVDVTSLDEAKERFQHCPCGEGAEIQLRPIYELAEFEDNMTTEVRELNESIKSGITDAG